jgi:D-3-phosphoglycerate dehydrogenase
MASFKVALVALDGGACPEWVSAAITKEPIDFVVQECKTDDELARVAADADLVWLFGGSRILTPHNLGLLPRCGAILRSGSGTDNVPVEAATQRGIVVAHTPQATAGPVADHVIGLMFAVLRHIGHQDRAVRRGSWTHDRRNLPAHVSGKVLGLVGFGHIPRRLARKVSGLEMTILAHDPYVSSEVMSAAGVQPVSLDELLARSDVVSLHCPLTKANHHLINEPALRRMKPTAVLINTCRGPVIDEPALARALAEGWIAGAGLDVLEQEPPAPDSPLLQMDNVVLTPHIAGYSETFLHDFWRFSVEAVLALAQHRWPAAWVNRDVKPRWSMAAQS